MTQSYFSLSMYRKHVDEMIQNQFVAIFFWHLQWCRYVKFFQPRHRMHSWAEGGCCPFWSTILCKCVQHKKHGDSAILQQPSVWIFWQWQKNTTCFFELQCQYSLIRNCKKTSLLKHLLASDGNTGKLFRWSIAAANSNCKNFIPSPDAEVLNCCCECHCDNFESFIDVRTMWNNHIHCNYIKQVAIQDFPNLQQQIAVVNFFVVSSKLLCCSANQGRITQLHEAELWL